MPQPLVFDPDTTHERLSGFWRRFKVIVFALYLVSLYGFLRLIVTGFVLRPDAPPLLELLARAVPCICFGLTILLACARPRFYRVGHDEIVLARYRIADKLATSWWVTSLLWPGCIVGVMMILTTVLVPSVRPASPDWVLAALVGTGLSTYSLSTVFLATYEIRMDREGIRIGFIYFLEWENVSRVVDTGGRFEVFGRHYPMPLAEIEKDNERAVVFLQDQLIVHGIPLETGAPSNYMFDKLLYVALATILLGATIATWLVVGTDAGLCGVSHIWGFFILTQVARWRGLAKVTRVLPPINRASLRLKPGQSLPVPSYSDPPIPNP